MGSAIQETAAELETRLTDVRAKAELIYRMARDDGGRDLLDSEQATIARLGKERDELNAQLNLALRSWEVDDGVAAKLREIRGAGGASSAGTVYRSAGHLLWDMLHAQNDPDVAARYRRAIVEPTVARAAEHLGLDKANTVPVAGGFNGLVVAPNVGPVLDPYPGDMPLFAALAPQTITSATFSRPRIVDPNFDTGVTGGKKEKEEGASKAWDILTEQVTMDVVRGYINVSELLLEMIAGSLDMVVGHMNKRLAHMLEGTAITRIGATTASVPLAADADAATVQKALATASGMVAAATGQWATWVAMGIDGAVRLASLTNLAGDAILNITPSGDVSAPPTGVYGLRPILSVGIAGADLFVGNGESVEAYERRFPIMQALEPALFGRQIGVAGGYAYYDPITTESPDGGVTPAKREGVVKVDWA